MSLTYREAMAQCGYCRKTLPKKFCKKHESKASINKFEYLIQDLVSREDNKDVRNLINGFAYEFLELIESYPRMDDMNSEQCLEFDLKELELKEIYIKEISKLQ